MKTITVKNPGVSGSSPLRDFIVARSSYFRVILETCDLCLVEAILLNIVVLI